MPVEFELKIKEVIERTYNVLSVRLTVDRDIEYKAGQFLCVWLKPEDEYKRYLSISSSPTEKGFIEFTKKITDSPFSQAFKNLKPGTTLKVQYPFGKFVLDEQAKKIAFLSGGIGITPIRSISRYIVDRDLGTDVALIYANRTIGDIAFKDELEAMQVKYPKLKVTHVISEAPVSPFEYISGRINSRVIKEIIPDYLERKFYLCGPPQMVEAMKKMLVEELLLSEDKIVTENFAGY